MSVKLGAAAFIVATSRALTTRQRRDIEALAAALASQKKRTTRRPARKPSVASA